MEATMTAFKTLPEVASLDFEQKQAKALVKAVKAEETDAINRIRDQLPNCEIPISLREAQLVLAREYGYNGWPDLKAEVLKRSGRGLEWAAGEARRAIDANDLERLRGLVGEYPELLSWRDPDRDGEVLLEATTSYANFPGEFEETYNRRDCAEFLIDAGATVDSRVYLRIMDTASTRMLDLFAEKDIMPRNLRVAAAIGDLEGIRDCFDENGVVMAKARPDRTLRNGYTGAADHWPDPDDDVEVIADAFLYAVRLARREAAEYLLRLCMQRVPALSERIDAWCGESAFVDYFVDHRGSVEFGGQGDSEAGIIWEKVVMIRLTEAIDQGNAEAFRDIMATETFVLEAAFNSMQVQLLELASYSRDAEEMIVALLERNPAILQADPPPESAAVSYAIEYGFAYYVPHLTRIWPVPDGLPQAAGLADWPNIRKWFDEDGSPKLGDLKRHNPFPVQNPTVTVQDVLDRALAWAVMNGEYEAANFMLEREADINTRWSTHEPASIMHECAMTGRLEQVKYLASRGYDLSITDPRFNGTAEGWARNFGETEIAEFLAEAAKQDPASR